MNLISRELRLATTSQPADTTVDILFHATGECALGKVLVARSAKGICAILPGEDPGELQADLAGRFPKATLVANEAAVRDELTKIARYADRPSETIDLTLDMRGTPLKRRVREKIRAIPVGTTVTCMQLGRLISCVYPLTAARVVAHACAANPLALAIPCHRVIHADGKLAGHRWGLARKRALIEKEAAA